MRKKRRNWSRGQPWVEKERKMCVCLRREWEQFMASCLCFYREIERVQDG